MSRLFSLHYKKSSGFKTERVMPNKKRKKERKKKEKEKKEKKKRKKKKKKNKVD